MLHLLDEALETFLRAEVPLPAHEYAVSFAAPDKAWSAARSSMTTVNVYLRDVRRNSTMREVGLERLEDDGRPVWRQPLPLVDCRYLVTVWAEDTGDEHSTLGSLLSTLLVHDSLAERHLPPPYAHVRPVPRLQLRTGEGDDDADFWSALGGQLKPGLDVLVTAAVDAGVTRAMGPPVQDYVLRTSDGVDGHAGERRVGAPGTGPQPEDVLPPDLLARETPDLAPGRRRPRKSGARRRTGDGGGG